MFVPQQSDAPRDEPELPPREDVWFLSSGVRCAAWFYRPAAPASTPPPVVVMAHGLGGTRALRLDAYARRFAAAGIAAVVFDYRYSGDSDGTPRQLVDIGRQIEDWHAALAFVRSELDVDRARIAIWGTSFGGGHVMRVAAQDGDLRALVAQCPFSNGPSSILARARAGFLSASVLTTAAVLDTIGALFRLPPIRMPMAGTRFMPAFLSAGDALGGAAGLVEPGTVLSDRTSRTLRRFPRIQQRLGPGLPTSERPVPGHDHSRWGTLIDPTGATIVNALPARLVFPLFWYRPGRDLKRIGTTQALVCVCDLDTAAPPGPTARAGKGLANVRVNHYPYGHFDIYVGEGFERAVADQTAFLEAQLEG